MSRGNKLHSTFPLVEAVAKLRGKFGGLGRLGELGVVRNIMAPRRVHPTTTFGGDPVDSVILAASERGTYPRNRPDGPDGRLFDPLTDELDTYIGSYHSSQFILLLPIFSSTTPVS